MFCIKCRHNRTQVINSRPHKKTASIWRRRKCPKCGETFTTTEHADLRYSSELLQPQLGDFNIGRLTISIAHAFQHDEKLGKEHASALANTIMTGLALRESLDAQSIKEETYRVLRRFDESAALAYALQHSMRSR